MEKYGYIYCTTDLTNGMKYIGQKKSGKFIQNYFGSGKIIKPKLKKRPDDFRVDLIEWCYNQEELNEREYDWTVAIGLYPLSYNLCYGGGATSGYKHTKESKIAMSENTKGEKHPFYRMKRPEHSEKMKVAMMGKNIGKIHSEKFCKNRSEKMKGENNPMNNPEVSKKVSEALKDIPKSEEHKRNISIANTGKHWYNNGEKETQLFECPKGFIHGRLSKKKAA